MTLRLLERGTQDTTRSIRIDRLKAELEVLEQIPATLLLLESSDNTAYAPKRLTTYVPEVPYEKVTMMDHWAVGHSDYFHQVPLWRRWFKGERRRTRYNLWLREDGAIVHNVTYNTGHSTMTTPYTFDGLPCIEFTVLLQDLKKIQDTIAQPHY